MILSENSDLISILVPTRNRPENVIRLINSAVTNSNNPKNLEFIFYVDDDDKSFPDLDSTIKTKIVYGPRMWLSIMQNILYANASGDILMYAADDIEFQSKDWDIRIKQEFEKYNDKILLVFGNDKGTHGEKIATHGFLHRRWIETLGVFAAPMRLSLSDQWHTENARQIGRLVYLPDLVIKHIHYRQGEKEAFFDNTYKDVYLQSNSWRPAITYKKLKRERRIDRVLLSEAMSNLPKIEFQYALGELIARKFLKHKSDYINVRRLRSVSNINLLFLMVKYVIKRTTQKWK